MSESFPIPQDWPSAPFDHHAGPRLVFGAGSVEQVGTLARELGARKVLLVTDRGVIAAGHAPRVANNLKAAGVNVALFGEVRENPTTRDVDECLRVARAGRIDAIVGLGGGSSLDIAKGTNFLLTNGGCIHDYWGVGKASKPMLPLIAIPTTAGTGSECQSFALIADETTHQKMACGDFKAMARIAMLDPTLTISQPRQVAACTGIDAIAHAVETAVTRKRNALSWLHSRESFRLLSGSFARVLRRPDDVAARGRMLLGAALAGCAIENSMLGAAHSAANPLTANFGIVHGQAVGLMLPAVVRFNAGDRSARPAYAELAASLNDGARGKGAPDWKVLVAHLEHMLNLAGMPKSLADCGVPRSAIGKLATEATQQWTAAYNPRPVGKRDFVKLYEAAFELR